MIEFTDRQKRIVSLGITAVALAMVLVFVTAVAWGALKLLTFLSSALVPVIFGFFLSLFFRPYYDWWKRLVHNPTVAMLLMLASVLVPVGFLLWYAGSILVEQVSNFIAQLPQLMRQVTEWINGLSPRMAALMDQLGAGSGDSQSLVARYSPTAMEAGNGVVSGLRGCVSALVTLIFFIFFLSTKERRGGEIVAHMPFLKPETQAFLGEQVDAFFEILVSFFQRQTVICLIEGVMYGLGFTLVGLPYGFLIGFMLGVINLIPFFGSLVCLPFALPLAYFGADGSAVRLVLVLVVWLCGQVMDGYFITPKIQGNKTGLGYAGVIFSFFFWSTVLGPLLGMLLAIPLSAFCVVLWRAIRSKYIRPVV